MKKLLIIIVIIAALGGLYLWLAPTEPAADSTSTTVGGAFDPDASGATFVIEGDTVLLSRGHGESRDEAIGLVTETDLLDERATGDMNDDGKPDAVVLLSQSGGGSGTFIYVAAFVSGPVGYKGTNAVFLGDRIEPSSVTISKGVATVHYLDRKPDEPMSAEPTVPTTKQFIYANGEFVEK